MAQRTLDAVRMKARFMDSWRDVELLVENAHEGVESAHERLAIAHRQKEAQREMWRETFGEEPPPIHIRAFTEREERTG